MPDSESLRRILKSQYHASLAMLRETIEQCPEGLWLSDAHKNAFWQVAYHTLFFAQMYLSNRMSKFEHQLVNLRHIQHHAAQLADRIRSSQGIGIRWGGAALSP